MPSDLISRKALLEVFKRDFKPVMFGYEYVMQSVKEAPAVDAVEVVRCKECKHGKSPTVCRRLGTVVKPNDFCSYGCRVEE